MRVCYHMQTHKAPDQVSRLVEVIKEGSPDAVVLISHDVTGTPLDVRRLEARDGVHVMLHSAQYGGFSHLERYFAAADWLDLHGVHYDWLANLSGQDYPLRPIAEMEAALAASTADGYLQYAPVFPEDAPAGADTGTPGFRLCKPFDADMRYRYRHVRLGRPTPAKQRWLRPAMIVDFIQPWVRLTLAFSAVGVRRRQSPFTDDFVLYGGSFFCTLSAECVRYARDYALQNPEIVEFFRGVLGPEEVFLQTVLVNSGKFQLVPDSRRYVDFTRSRNNHPKILGMADLPALTASGADWARKFDLDHDAAVLDVLDERVRRREPDQRELTAS